MARASHRIAAALLPGFHELRDHAADLDEVDHGQASLGCILVADLIMGLLIVSNVGPRLRGEPYGVTNPKLA